MALSPDERTKRNRRYIWSVWIGQIGLPTAALSEVVRAYLERGGIGGVLTLHTTAKIIRSMLVMVPIAYAIGALFWRLGLTGSDEDAA